MSSTPSTTSAASSGGVAAVLFRFAVPLYSATLFLSALLLFTVQPMFAKMVLPILGGAPSVWSVAMVFFQGALLAGYAYAHILARTFPPGQAALLHLVLLGIAGFSLPISVYAIGHPPATGVELWLMMVFTVSIGLPFTVLSANAPLLQSWFAASGHVRAKNPYVLYAASNLGSFVALLFYPFLFEPLLTLREQTLSWSVGYVSLTMLIAASGLVVARAASVPLTGRAAGAAPTWRERLIWIALAAIPSGLVVAATAHITTDIAAAPFLWVVPLALYLLTFVALFRDRPWVSGNMIAGLVPIVVAASAALAVLGSQYWLVSIGVTLIGFLVIALHCHGQLYARRPSPARLTEFYLLISVGGVIGGAFAGLFAPNFFNGTWEYPILLSAALLCLPGAFDRGVRGFVRDAGLPLAVAAFAIGVAVITAHKLPASAALPFKLGLPLLAAVAILFRERPARAFGLLSIVFVAAALWQPGSTRLETARSFFGVHKVIESEDGTLRALFHGTTIHGAQEVRTKDGRPIEGRPEAISYYYSGGPFREAVEAARNAQRGFKRAAVAGLGTGSLACYGRPGEEWTFFEIDPEVVRIARDPNLFRFLASCAPNARIVLGDARLTLAASPDKYGVIVVDVFSSDAIPVHLLTREAVAGYLSRLDRNGVIVLHISNRHMELGSVVGAIAESLGLAAFKKDDRSAKGLLVDRHTNASVAVLARKVSDLGILPKRPGWQPLTSNGVAAWTDDYSNIIAAIIRGKFGN